MASASRDAVEVDDDIEVLRHQLEEIVFHNESSKGKHAADKPPDHEIAISTFQADIEAYIEVLSDRGFAHSVAAALEQDATIVAQIAREEDLAQRDRELALRISGGNVEARKFKQNNEACIDASATGIARKTSNVTENDTITVAEEEIEGSSTAYADVHNQSPEELPKKSLSIFDMTTSSAYNANIRTVTHA